MSGIVITWQQLLFLAVIVIGIYVAELLLFLRKSAQQSSGRGPDSGGRDEMRKLQHDVQVLREEVALLTARLEARPGSLDNEAESPYSQAIKLARQGLDSTAVASGCGISRGEAELIVALYRAAGRS